MADCRAVALKLNEKDVPSQGYLPADCCQSCHEDHEEHGVPLCSAGYDDELEVCCIYATRWGLRGSEPVDTSRSPFPAMAQREARLFGAGWRG